MITTLLFAAALQTSTMAPTTPAPTTPPADLPRCSKTVTDSCMEGGSMGKHHAMKKTMHHKMAHKTMKKADTAKMDASATDKK